MPLIAPRPRPLSHSHPCQKGFGLFEVLLGIGAVSLMSVAVYSLFFASDVSADVKSAQENMGSLTTRLERSYGTTGGFAGLTLDRAIADGVLPTAYTRGGRVGSEWGEGFDVRSHTVSRDNDSFVVQYSHVPTEACTRLASAMAPHVYDLRISGSTVVSSTGLDLSAVGSQCNRTGGAVMEFVYYSGLASGQAVATPSPSSSSAAPALEPTSPPSAASSDSEGLAATSGASSARPSSLPTGTAQASPGPTAAVTPGVAPAAPLPSASVGRTAAGGAWVSVGPVCEHVTTASGTQNSCPDPAGWQAWQDIPNPSGLPLCALTGPSFESGTCANHLTLDTRTEGCTPGAEAVVEEFRAEETSDGKRIGYSFHRYRCR